MRSPVALLALILNLSSVKGWSIGEFFRGQAADHGEGTADLANTFKDQKDRFIIEMAWLQDFSSSFKGSLDLLREQLPEVMREVQGIFPDSRFALAGFVDKPVGDFGYNQSGDYCYRLKYPLTSHVDNIKDSLHAAFTHSGGDWKEGQLHGMLGLATDAQAGWTNFTKSDDNRRVERLLFVMTDSVYHQAGDAPDLQTNNADGVESCLTEDYPSIQQVKKALDDNNITPVFIVESFIAPVYKQLVHLLGDRGVVSVAQKNDPTQLKRAMARGVAAVTNHPSRSGCRSRHCCCHKHCCGGGSCNKDAAAVIIKLQYTPKKLQVLAEY